MDQSQGPLLLPWHLMHVWLAYPLGWQLLQAMPRQFMPDTPGWVKFAGVQPLVLWQRVQSVRPLCRSPWHPTHFVGRAAAALVVPVLWQPAHFRVAWRPFSANG